MELESVLDEYMYYCKARNYTQKTIINKTHEYKHLKLYLQEKRGVSELESITIHDMRAYIRHKTDSGLKPQSIVSMAKMIIAFFNWCVNEDYLSESPMKKVELPKVQKKVLKGFTAQEVFDMINAFSSKTYVGARNKAILAILADCGIRSIEIRNLKVQSLNETTILVDGKGNKQRLVSISPVLKRILIQYERQKQSYFRDKMVKSDKYFLSYKGTELSHVGLYNIVREAGLRAKVDGGSKRISPHSFRHFFTVQSLLSGKFDLFSLSKYLGHSDISVTQAYLSSLENSEILKKAEASSPLMNLRR